MYFSLFIHYYNIKILLFSIKYKYLIILNHYSKNYIILQRYIKCILPPLTEMIGPIMNLISGIYHFCERREYVFNVLLEYYIITPLS